MFNRQFRIFLLSLLPWLSFVFVAAQGGTEDLKSTLPYLFAVYTIAWAAFFAYAFFLSRKQVELEREVETLRRTLDGRGGDPGNSI
jgi:CcmD family protein